MPAAPAIIGAVAAVAGTAASIHQGNQAKKNAAKQLQAQEDATKEQKAIAQQELNAKESNAFDSSNAQAAVEQQTGGVGTQTIIGQQLAATSGQKKNILGAS